MLHIDELSLPTLILGVGIIMFIIWQHHPLKEAIVEIRRFILGGDYVDDATLKKKMSVNEHIQNDSIQDLFEDQSVYLQLLDFLRGPMNHLGSSRARDLILDFCGVIDELTDKDKIDLLVEHLDVVRSTSRPLLTPDPSKPIRPYFEKRHILKLFVCIRVDGLFNYYRKKGRWFVNLRSTSKAKSFDFYFVPRRPDHWVTFIDKQHPNLTNPDELVLVAKDLLILGGGSIVSHYLKTKLRGLYKGESKLNIVKPDSLPRKEVIEISLLGWQLTDMEIKPYYKRSYNVNEVAITSDNFDFLYEVSLNLDNGLIDKLKDNRE